MDTENTVPPEEKNPLPKLYNPKEYGVIGFIFSVLPVFLMSFHNAKFLPNGEAIKAKLKTWMVVFAIFFILEYGVSTWAIVHIMKAVSRSVIQNPAQFLAVMQGSLEGIATADVSFAQSIIENSNVILIISNFILLILVITYTNKNEIPAFNEMRENKKIEVAPMLFPVAVGIAFIGIQLYFSETIIIAIAKLFV